MTDVMSADKRSALMSRIRGRDTAPELQVRKLLWHAGFRYRLHDRSLAGRPDLVLPRWHVAIFVHGCFWHWHEGCALFQLPKSRAEFWELKLKRNRERDAAAVQALAERGWRVAVVWECALRASPTDVALDLIEWIRSDERHLDLSERTAGSPSPS